MLAVILYSVSQHIVELKSPRSELASPNEQQKRRRKLHHPHKLGTCCLEEGAS